MIHANRKGTTGISSEFGFCGDEEGKKLHFPYYTNELKHTVSINCTFTSI